jgi:5-methylcytosine-specific restriction endonuclease McrA
MKYSQNSQAIYRVRKQGAIDKWKRSVPKGRCLNDGKTHFKKEMVPWNKGIPMSPETKQKMRATKALNPSRPWLGKKRDKETIQKIANKKKGKPSWNFRKPQLQTRGEKHPNWKGGVSSENRRVRSRIEFRLWRESVFALDNWTCQKCKERGNYLHPHHILNFALYPDLRFSINNGITFCKQCHKKFHERYGNKNNSQQITEFIGRWL